MTELTLRPMTAQFYERWIAGLMRGYADDHVAAGSWSADEALAKSQAETDSLLPDGLETKNHLLLTAFNDDGEAVGVIWIATADPRPGAAWIYDIEVLEGHRGSGYGRALLTAGEQAAKEAGATAIGLNVFGPNATARALYESSGYEVTSMHMRKEL